MWSRRPALPRKLRAALLALGMAWMPAAGAAASGAVVAAAAPGSAAERAGLLPGDVLLGWERPPDHGVFATPWDVWIVEIEQAPRGGLALNGKRAGRDLLVQPPPGDWQLTVGPHLADLSRIEGWSLFQRAEALLGAQEAAGLAKARELYLQAQVHPAHQFRTAQIQIWERIGRADLALEDFPGAQDAFRRALSILDAGSEDSLLKAFLWHRIGQAAKRMGDLAGEEAFRRGWEIRRRLAPGSLAEAASLEEIGSMAAFFRYEPEAAEEPLRRAWEIRRRLEPDGLDAIRSLNALGALASLRNHHEEAHQFLDEALARVEIRAPGTLLHSQVLNSRGLLAQEEGDLSTATAFLRRTLEIDQKLVPGSTKIADTLNNLGSLVFYRGDFATAEAMFEKSLAIREKARPGSPLVVQSVTNLGIVATEQGDDERARELLERALALSRQAGIAEGLNAVFVLAALGTLAIQRGDLPAAEDFFRRALAIVERHAPDSNKAAEVLVDLGRLARQKGDFDAAEQHLRRALERAARLGPRSFRVARYLGELADLALARERWAEAEDLYQQALALSRLTPGTLNEAHDLRGLGQIKAHTGRKAEAASLLLQALDALEAQVAVAGATRDVRTAFRAAGASFYADAVDALLDLGQVEAAFRIVERSRARELLELLAERDLELSQGLPPELAAQRRQLAQEDDRLQDALSQLQVDQDAAEIQRLTAQRKEVGERRARLSEEIRRAAPRQAAFTDPRVLGWPEVRATLDPGTALLSYLVEESRTVLFVGIAADPPRPLAVVFLPLGDQALRQKVARLQQLVARRNRQRSAADSVARELYDALLAPAAPLLADAHRLLILPDGPLHVLPFAALVRGTSRGPQYLVEWKPFSTAASATVHAELLRTRSQGSSPAAIFAFGDPQYRRAPEAAAEPSPALRSSLRRGLALHPLPASREEARAIARLFGDEAHLYLGPEATEEKVKSISRARYLHFACHGLYNQGNPLDSALALTLPETFREDRDNGLLQAWEIFEQVHLEADLVTLSACQSGLGQEVAGEGLIGLTRAFHYAGARSVVASLWEVTDRSTADLMQRFYAALRQGSGKDEALRQAQLALIRRSLPPFHWAAFQLSGDWR